MRPYIKADGAAVPDLKHKPSHYLRHNMWVSTSGNYLPAAFNCTREALGMERIVLGTDHPYEFMHECMDFLAGLPLTAEERTQLYSTNGAALGMRLGHAHLHGEGGRRLQGSRAAWRAPAGARSAM